VFAGLINQAKSTVSGLVLKYVARASVAVPFVIAVGFAFAAITVMLVERYGHVMGYWLMAGGLGVLGVVAATVVSVKQHEEEGRSRKDEKTDPAEVVTDATAQAIRQATGPPLALRWRSARGHQVGPAFNGGSQTAEVG
jgi:transposase InsO family protein